MKWSLLKKLGGHGQIRDRRTGPLEQLKSYIFPFVGITAVTIVQMVFIDVFEGFPLFFYWPVVILAGWIGGLGAGLFAAILAIISTNYFILPTRFTFTARAIDFVLLLLFAAITVFMSWLRQREQRAQALIRQQQLEMQITLSSIGDGVIVTDAFGCITFINSVAERLTGWPQADALNQQIESVFHIVNEDTREPTANPLIEALKQGVVVGLANHTVLISRTGEEWPISDSGAPIRDTNNQIIGAVIVFRDVSDERHYQRQLEASEERYRNLVDNATDIIYTLDMEGHITSINPVAEQITGYSQSELINMSLDKLITGEDLKRSEAMRERKLAGEEKTVYELDIITKNRQRRTLEVSSQLTREGDVWGVEGIARDITLRKETERRILTLHNISAALAKAVTLQEVVSVIIDEALGVLDAHHGAVGLVTDAGRTLELLRLTNLSDEDFEHYRYTDIDDSGPMTDSIRIKAPIWIESQTQYLEQYPHYREIVQNVTKTQAAAALPLRIRSQIIGSIMISFPEPRAISADERGFLETIADYCAQSIERARLYEAEQQVREILQTRIRQQSIIAEIGQQALISRDLTALMDSAAGLVARTLDVEFVKILELQEDDSHLLLRAGIGWKDGYVGHATEGTDLDSPAGYTLKIQEPMIVEDLRTETRFNDPPLLHEHDVVSGMSVIIQGYDRPFGVLGVYTTEKRTFSHDDIYFVQSMANVLGAAIENDRLAEQAKDAATLEERQRLARELHDSVTQAMFAATSRAELIPRLWEKNPATGMEHLKQVILLNRGAMAEMRALLLELRPEAILNNTLANLFQQLVAAAPVRVEIEGDLIIHGEALTLPPDVHFAFYRIVQEAVNNVLKHSGATKFHIEVNYGEDDIEVAIVDNGRGFSQDEVQAGFGLGSMRERADGIGAHLNVVSAPQQGTRLEVRWAKPSS
ncbi:MAG: hypothetical protein CL610_10200 [Anaerolineaceae bacterium]|nr:hypothetical protein [Anaerolineaceae bacterium]